MTTRSVMSRRRTVLTIGYNGREPHDFIRLLLDFGISMVIDVRRWPKSKLSKFYDKESLEPALRGKGIKYLWLGAELGGYRRLGVDIDDDGSARCFKSRGFSAYAQYMLRSPNAEEGLKRVKLEAERSTASLLCKERYPWACHRKLISDWLVHKGFRVLHIIDIGEVIEHKLTKCAKIDENGKLRYL